MVVQCRSVVPESYRASALRVEAALIDFRSLEMVLHANLAEQFLRGGR